MKKKTTTNQQKQAKNAIRDSVFCIYTYLHRRCVRASIHKQNILYIRIFTHLFAHTHLSFTIFGVLVFSLVSFFSAINNKKNGKQTTQHYNNNKKNSQKKLCKTIEGKKNVCPPPTPAPCPAPFPFYRWICFGSFSSPVSNFANGESLISGQ